jgi:hypothetical protein
MPVLEDVIQRVVPQDDIGDLLASDAGIAPPHFGGVARSVPFDKLRTGVATKQSPVK